MMDDTYVYVYSSVTVRKDVRFMNSAEETSN